MAARWATRWALLLIALLAAAARLPFVALAPGSDEAGFLLVGAQWHPGTSLYGDYWVDRPPLLITIFRVAAELGGLVPLRVIGALATAWVVLGAAQVAGMVAGEGRGERAARWAAGVAAVLCVSPVLGGLEVNGELLAAPVVLTGIAAILHAVRAERTTRAVLFAVGAGAAMVAALLIKQNVADVGVFAAVLLLSSTRPGRLRIGAGVLTGAALCLALVAGWTVVHGTSLAGVYDAMYPFRVDAARVMAASDRHNANTRLWLLVVAWALSTGPLLLAAFGWRIARGRVRDAASLALAATCVFDIASIAMGGSFWPHYLIQLAGPTAAVAGILVAEHRPWIRSSLIAAAAVAALGWVALLPNQYVNLDNRVGEAIAAESESGDTIVTVWGHAGVVDASGLRSPYPYLWSLPAHTLDPRYAAFDQTLSGPAAPTWVVLWSSFGPNGVSTARLLAQHYHPVAEFSGHTVYLRDGLRRGPPRLDESRRPPTFLSLEIR